MPDLKNGEVYNIEGVTLGLVSKIDVSERKAVVVCLDFPYFRLMDMDDFLLTSVKVADSSRSLVAQLSPIDSKDTSVSAWETEIESLADDVLDLVSEEYDEETLDPDDEDMLKKVKKIARVCCRASEWITDSTLNDKVVKYSITYLDVEPQDILMYIPDDKRHIWTVVRRAAALAHLISDVCEKVWDTVQENSDDYEDDKDDEI